MADSDNEEHRCHEELLAQEHPTGGPEEEHSVFVDVEIEGASAPTHRQYDSQNFRATMTVISGEVLYNNLKGEVVSAVELINY